jgi:enoyl-CoA hydratase
VIETTRHGAIAVLTTAHGPVNALDLELLTALPDAVAGVADAAASCSPGAGRRLSDRDTGPAARVPVQAVM